MAGLSYLPPHLLSKLSTSAFFQHPPLNKGSGSREREGKAEERDGEGSTTVKHLSNFKEIKLKNRKLKHSS